MSLHWTDNRTDFRTPGPRERGALRLSWVLLVFVFALALILSAGKGDTLERCPDGQPRPIGTCHE